MARRQMQAQAALAAHLEASASALTPSAKLAVQLRNEAAARKRQALLEEKAKAASRRATVQDALVKQVAVSAPRDPDRVLRPTSAHNTRVAAAAKEKEQPKGSGYVLQVAHKATPSWMRG